MHFPHVAPFRTLANASTFLSCQASPQPSTVQVHHLSISILFSQRDVQLMLCNTYYFVMSHYAFTVFAATTTCIGLSVFWTILKQIVVRNPNEPPFVRYWVPIIGNAVTYGMDPHGFFAKCQQKVGQTNSTSFPSLDIVLLAKAQTTSMAISSPSCCSAERLQSISVPKATTSS